MIQFRPGQQIKDFDLMRKKIKKDAKGRVTFTSDPQKIGVIKGSISAASQSEQDRFKQQGHPISHTLVIKGHPDVKAEDILQINGRKFYVHAKDVPGELGIYTVLYCGE